MKNCTFKSTDNYYVLKRVPNCPAPMTDDDLKYLSVEKANYRMEKVENTS